MSGRSNSWVRSAVLGGGTIASLLVVGATLLAVTGGPVMDRRVSLLCINLLVVLGLQTFTGNSGIVSFGHVAFMAIGAYASALLTIAPSIKMAALPDLPTLVAQSQLGFVVAMVIAIALVALIALAVGTPLVRLSGSAGAIATFALLVIVNVVLSGWTGVTGGRRALYGMPGHASTTWAIVFAAVAVLGVRVFRDSPLGLQLRASQDDEVAAEAMGVAVRRGRLIAWVLSAVLAGLAGVLFAHFVAAFSPQQFFLAETITTLAMLIVGGMRTVSGAVLGAVVLYIASEVLRGVESATAGVAGLPGLFGLAQIVIALVLLLVLYLRPQGLWGRWEINESAQRALRRRSTNSLRTVRPSHLD